MKRVLALTLLLLACASAAHAVDAPPGQVHLNDIQVLRGQFVDQRQIKGVNGPMQSTGHFVLAPGHGLIWAIEKPFATASIITPNGMAQDLGGIALKLPAKNLHHLYEMVGGALSGDWSGLENDFTIARSGTADHWQMVLTPRNTAKPALAYTSITVTGSKFVEDIAMLKGDGTSDTLSFSQAVLSPAPPSPQENALFAEVK